MFAVIKTGGKQYRVAADDLLKVDRIAANAGDIVEFNAVLAVGEGDNVYARRSAGRGRAGSPRKWWSQGQEPGRSSHSRSAAARIRAAAAASASC